jgi:hypothetical protein
MMSEQPRCHICSDPVTANEGVTLIPPYFCEECDTLWWMGERKVLVSIARSLQVISGVNESICTVLWNWENQRR